MRTSIKLAFTALAAAGLLAAVVGSASANNLSVDSRSFYAIWEDESQRLSFNAAVRIECEVTLLGSFHENTITKTPGLLVGHITHASVDSEGCNNGEAFVQEESLPWEVNYESYAGTLPNITRVRLQLINAAFEIESGLGPHCLAITSRANPAAGEILLDEESHAASLAADPDNRIPITDTIDSDPFLGLDCEDIGVGTFSGTGDVAEGEEGSETDIAVTLI